MPEIINPPLTQQDIADKLLWPLWRCIDETYKDRYKREIWEHFENAIRSAAYTSRLSKFLSTFKKRMPIDLQAQYAADVAQVIECSHDADVLRWLRDETSYMALLVRLRNKERKESFNEQ